MGFGVRSSLPNFQFPGYNCGSGKTLALQLGDLGFGGVVPHNGAVVGEKHVGFGLPAVEVARIRLCFRRGVPGLTRCDACPERA